MTIMLSSILQVVYVGVIAPAHRELVLLMLANNKAVLCEKPLGLSLVEVGNQNSLLT